MHCEIKNQFEINFEEKKKKQTEKQQQHYLIVGFGLTSPANASTRTVREGV